MNCKLVPFTPLWMLFVFMCLLFPSAYLKADKCTFDVKNDTLFLTVDSLELPNNIVLVSQGESNLYKGQSLQYNTDVRCGDDLASSLYNNIWTSEKLNPYKTAIDSLPDSLQLDLSCYHIPACGYVTSRFGRRGGRFHYGTDIKVMTGDPIYSAFDGVVRIVDYEHRGYGHYVVIRHRNGLETVYGHMSRVWVKENQPVRNGDVIGVGGNTGRSTGSHLHFELRYIGNAFNPELIFDFAESTVKSDTFLVTKKDAFYHQAILKELAAIRYHTIRSGESLGKIAQRYGTSVSALCRLNKMRPNSVIYAGKRIRVR